MSRWKKALIVFSILLNLFALGGYAYSQYGTVQTFFIYYAEGHYTISYGRPNNMIPERIDVKVWKNGTPIGTATYTR